MMPELPEVETIARELRNEALIGATIVDVQVSWPRTVSPLSVKHFQDRVQGQRVLAIARRGKYLIIQLKNGSLLCHLRMTGRFSFCASSAEVVPHERVRLTLSDGPALVFSDTRKFGRMQWVAEAEEALSHLGVEPLSPAFTVQYLSKCLEGRQRALKPLLLDQSLIAGLGNIYVDEALWDACLHPLQPAGQLSEADQQRLHAAIITVLERGIEHLGTSLGSGQTNYFSVSGRRGGNQYQLRVFRREGDPCPRCSTCLVKIRVGQRGTHLCPHCQQVNHP